MPFVREPHFCKPPIWPWMYRLGTVWRCRHCQTNYKVEHIHDRYSWNAPKKKWVRLDLPGAGR